MAAAIRAAGSPGRRPVARAWALLAVACRRRPASAGSPPPRAPDRSVL